MEIKDLLMSKIPRDVYHTVLVRDNFRCVRCWDRAALTQHHIIHREHGGTDSPENLAVLCVTCHKEWHVKFNKKQGIRFDQFITPSRKDNLALIREMNEKKDIPISFSEMGSEPKMKVVKFRRNR